MLDAGTLFAELVGQPSNQLGAHVLQGDVGVARVLEGDFHRRGHADHELGIVEGLPRIFHAQPGQAVKPQRSDASAWH